MSGSYPDVNAESVAVATADAIAEINAAMARVDARQAQSAAFMAQHGAAANNGGVVDVVPPAIGG
jgi:hypothetical protein